MTESDQKSEGLLDSLRKLVGTLLATLQNRIELFTVEQREEKYRIVEMLLLTGVMLFLGAMALALLIVVFIFLPPAEYRLAVAAGLGIFCLVGAFAAMARLKKRLKDQSFSETVNQLKKDLECLIPPK